MLRSDSESMFCYRFRFNCDRPFSESMTNMASCTLKPQLCTHSLFPLASHLHGICKVFQPHGTCKIRLQWVRHHLHCHTLTQKWESWKRPIMPDPRHCSLGATVFHHKRVAILTDVDLEHPGIPQINQCCMMVFD